MPVLVTAVSSVPSKFTDQNICGMNERVNEGMNELSAIMELDKSWGEPCGFARRYKEGFQRGYLNGLLDRVGTYQEKRK